MVSPKQMWKSPAAAGKSGWRELIARRWLKEGFHAN
jgi:hypothetical protein